MYPDKVKTTSPSRPEENESDLREISSLSLSSLVQRLKNDSEKEQQIISDLYQKKLHELGSGLSNLTQKELTKINQDLKKLTKRSWWLNTLSSATICAGFLMGSWGWAEWQVQRYAAAAQSLAEVQKRLAAEQKELKGVIWTRDPSSGVLWVKTTGKLGTTEQGQWAEVIVE